MNWSLDTAEQSLAIATATARPAIFALNGPITTIDQLLCKGIDIVEQRVPAVHLPPHLVSLQIFSVKIRKIYLKIYILTNVKQSTITYLYQHIVTHMIITIFNSYCYYK